MGGNHPINFDPRPKRRRDDLNPYELLTVGIETDSPQYYIKFTDGAGVEHCMEISRELYMLFDRFELEDLSYLNEVERHYAEEELTDEVIAHHALFIRDAVEQEAYQSMTNQRLRSIIASLPDKQRRRISLYYFGGYTYEEIAKMELCSVRSVHVAVKRAEEKIKKLFKEV